MAKADVLRTSVSSSVIVRQRPAVLLLKVRSRAAEANLELGLAKLKKQAEETAQWLKRLGADRVDVGEPHLAEHADKDPMKAMRAETARLLEMKSADETAGGRKREVMIVLTALWPIAGMSAEEAMLLVDRLQFEAADPADKPETPEDLPPWASPEEQVQEMMKWLHEEPPDDYSPQFLFISRIDEEQLEKAYAETFALASQRAERIARGSGVRLGKLWMLQYTVGKHASLRTDKLMNQQRCLAILDGCSYDLTDDEIVSDDPRAAEFHVSANLHYHLG